LRVAHEVRKIQSAGAPAPVGPYSQALAAGGFVFAAGQIPLDPASGRLVEGDIEEQTERVLANLGAVLEAAGSSLARVVRTTVYLADLADFPRMNEVYARHFASEPRPARTTIQAGRLPAGARIEVDAIAAL
jgi:2-iminobutanoate/2-iminopropanoate deaminase